MSNIENSGFGMWYVEDIDIELRNILKSTEWRWIYFRRVLF